MKNLKLFTILFVGVLTLLSFTEIKNEDTVVKLDVSEESIDQNGWGSWKTTDCFRGLDFRVKRKKSSYSSKTEWLVQFRNRYNNKIYFNFEIVPYSQRSAIIRSQRTTNRTDLNANTTERRTHYRYLEESNTVYVHVNKVRFNKDGSQSYSNCD
jgi:hypothetical protein